MDKQKLIKFAKIIIQEYLGKDVPPVETITKIASENRLSNPWISRLAELVNVSLNSNIREKYGSSMIQFDLIDPSIVIASLEPKPITKKASISSVMAGVTELERGMAKAAAAEYYNIINKEIESRAEKMEKVASINPEKYDPMFREKTIEFQKTSSEILRHSAAMQSFLEERIRSSISKLASIVIKEGYPSHIGYALGSMRASSKKSFEERSTVDNIMDMIKVSSATISSVKEPDVISPEMDKTSSAYALIDSIIKDGKSANAYKKAESMMKTHGISKLANTDKELKGKMEKLSLVGGILSKAIKNPLASYFAYSEVSGVPGKIRDDMGKNKGDEQTGYFAQE